MVKIGFTATDGNTYIFCRSFSTFDEGYFKVIERIQQDRNNNNVSSTLRCEDDKYLFTNRIVSIFLIDDLNFDDL